MKSLKKPFDTLDTKSERLATTREQRAADERTPPTGQPQRATQSAQSGKTGLEEGKAPREETRKVKAVRDTDSVNAKGDYAPPKIVKTLDGRVNPHLVCLLEPRSKQAESYYRLRHQLEKQRVSDDALVVAVTSAGPRDGKSLTAINLAGALARSAGSRILLLDLNLRRSSESVADYLAMEDSKDWGVVDWIQQEDAGLEPFTHHLEQFNLRVMTAGSDPEHPYELLKSPRLDELMRQVREDYDFVIVDAPQILRLPDTELISHLVDGFLIVVKANHTLQARLEEALNLMTEQQVLGLVFNGLPSSA